MSLDNLLAFTASRLGLDHLALNPVGVCRLIVDGTLGVTIEKSPLDGAVHFYTELMQLPDLDREPLYERLLEAQCFGRELGDGIRFGLDLQTGEMLLQRKLHLDGLSPDTFYAALTEFVNWTEHWNQKLSDQLPPMESAPSLHEEAETLMIRA